MESLEKLYRYLRWPMYPEELEAMKRYEAIKEFFMEKLGREIPLHREASILDVAAGTGIASIALGEALIHRGASVKEIMVTDIRREDQRKHINGWINATSSASSSIHVKLMGGN